MLQVHYCPRGLHISWPWSGPQHAVYIQSRFFPLDKPGHGCLLLYLVYLFFGKALPTGRESVYTMTSRSRHHNSRIATSVARVMYTNAVYFPNNRIYQGDTPALLNYSCVNRVYYAYASIGSDGGVFVSSLP